MKPRTILLEFNELTPSLIDRFIAAGDLPNFAKFQSESHVFTTRAEERAPYLEPWIQWVTVHSGLNYREHGIFHLDEGHQLTAKRLWDVLSDAGFTVWVCGSMNVRYDEDLNGCVLPDPWCTKVRPRPHQLRDYFQFVQQHVLEHTNEHLPLNRLDYARFVSFMSLHGLSPKTVHAFLSQFLEERRGASRWKRVVLLDLIQFDLFRHYYRWIKPDFSTFFLNSTAHYQHAYWDSMEPELFHRSQASEGVEHKDAIRFGYKQMDTMLARFMGFVGRDTTLILCTALSQQPWTNYEEAGASAFYRPKDFVQFATTAGIGAHFSVAPVMTEQFHLEFDSAQDAADSERTLQSIRLDGTPAINTQRDGARLFIGCSLHGIVADDAQLTLSSGQVRFYDLFYRVQTSKTGLHHPDGILWIRTPERRHDVVKAPVPLAAIAPTLLSRFRLKPPAHMKETPLPMVH